MNLGQAILITACVVFAAAQGALVLYGRVRPSTPVRTFEAISHVNQAICGFVAFVGALIWVWSRV